MKKSLQIAALTVAGAFAAGLAAPALAAGNHSHAGGQAHAHEPLHGGVVVEVRDVDYELVAQATQLRLYVRDHGKAADLSKAGAKLVLLSGADKQEVALKAMGDRFEATGSFKLGAGTKAVATVTFAGKPASTVRFVLR